MEDLRRICADCGFENVTTYIACGNIALSSALDPKAIARKLSAALEIYVGKPVGVFVRSHTELSEIALATPFVEIAGNKVTAVFVDDDPQASIDVGIKGQTDEAIFPGAGVIYVHYPNGMSTSKLKLIGAAQGTARNMNSTSKMVALTAFAFR